MEKVGVSPNWYMEFEAKIQAIRIDSPELGEVLLTMFKDMYEMDIGDFE